MHTDYFEITIKINNTGFCNEKYNWYWSLGCFWLDDNVVKDHRNENKKQTLERIYYSFNEQTPVYCINVESGIIGGTQ